MGNTKEPSRVYDSSFESCASLLGVLENLSRKHVLPVTSSLQPYVFASQFFNELHFCQRLFQIGILVSFWNTKDDLRVLRYLHLRKISLSAGFNLVSDGLKKLYRTLKFLKDDKNGIEMVI